LHTLGAMPRKPKPVATPVVATPVVATPVVSSWPRPAKIAFIG
jgi:hypothetical protein